MKNKIHKIRIEVSKTFEDNDHGKMLKQGPRFNSDEKVIRYTDIEKNKLESLDDNDLNKKLQESLIRCAWLDYCSRYEHGF